MTAIRRRLLVAAGQGVLFICTLTFCVGSIGAIWAARATTNAGLERTILEAAERPDVRREFANALTANAMPENGRLVLRDAPALDNAADATVTSPAFAQVVLLTVQDADLARASGSPDMPTAGRAERLFAATLRRSRPDLADRLPSGSRPVLDTTERSALQRALHAARRLARFERWLFAGSVLGLAAGLWANRPRHRRLGSIALLMASVGVGSEISRNLAISHLIGSAPSGPDRVLLDGVLRHATEPIAFTRLSWIWAAVMLGGLVLSAARRHDAPHNQAEVSKARPATRLTAPLTVQRVHSLAPTRAWGIALILVAMVLSTALLREAQRSKRALLCLGQSQICDRSLDRVTLAATHNSMNNRTDGFLFPEHESDVKAQLESGIRGLLIDTHYGKPSTDGRIWTDLVGIDRAELVRSYGEEAVAAGERARSALTEPMTTAGVYLCHNYCELGATPLQNTLRVVRDFLDAHPTEIVLLDIQDQTSPADTVRQFDEAELSDQVFTPPKANTWPTIRQLIAERTRLLVFTENEQGAAPWYQRAYVRSISDTPYSAIRIADLSGCPRDRGPSSAKLLLMNHWIETFPPQPSSATKSNDPGFIIKRAEACRKERGRYPTVIAVNWPEVGNVVSAVAELNRRSR